MNGKHTDRGAFYISRTSNPRTDPANLWRNTLAQAASIIGSGNGARVPTESQARELVPLPATFRERGEKRQSGGMTVGLYGRRGRLIPRYPQVAR